MKKSAATPLFNQNGAVLIWFVLFLPILIGMAAMAVDVSRLAVAKNELQNAADAGALAATRFLYNDDENAVNTGANQIGHDAAVANKSENLPVEVTFDAAHENDGDVQRGHWSFGLGDLSRGFYPNSDTTVVDLAGKSTVALDQDSAYINAVRVTVRRNDKPVITYFARIFGIDSWAMSASAVAYLGYTGSLGPGEVDLPIGICCQTITGEEHCCPSDENTDTAALTYNCSRGFMLSDGQTKNSAAWTNFSDPCATADTTSLRDLLTCADANPEGISLGSSIGATNGVVDAVINHPTFPSLVECWENAYVDPNPTDEETDRTQPVDSDADGRPDYPWSVTLPVVDCPGSQVSNCLGTCGVVKVDILWILEKENNIDADAPYKMHYWDAETGAWGLRQYSGTGITRWNQFVLDFNIKNADGNIATVANDGFKKKSIYFRADCTPGEPAGDTGGVNYGIRSKYPKLVE